MKKLVNIKGVLDNIRQSVNTPSPGSGSSSGSAGGPGGGSTPGGPVRLESGEKRDASSLAFTYVKQFPQGENGTHLVCTTYYNYYM